MRKKLVLLCMMLMLTGCGKVTEPTEGEATSESVEPTEESMEKESSKDTTEAVADTKQLQEWLDSTIIILAPGFWPASDGRMAYVR